ncbi:MAG: TrmH family RNA methyltransferase, partial [Pirellulaceae bacterium]|nr:TrmH family RNA methyltransferase [Pirellulaceae bacterium]
MFNLPALSSRDNPRIKTVLNLRGQRHRRQTGLLVAEGTRQLVRAHEAKLVMHWGLVCPTIVRPHEFQVVASLGSRRHRTDLPPQWFRVSEPLMRKISYRQNPQGVLAVFEQPIWDLDALVRREAALPTPLWLVPVGTTKPGNLGAMVRSADAAGAWGVLVADGLIDPFNPNTIRASTAAVFTLPVVSQDAQTILSFLERNGVQIFVATPAAAMGHTQVDMTGPTALVIGAEDRGLTSPWVHDNVTTRPEPAHRDAAMKPSIATRPIAIPTAGRTVDSLNAAA